MNGSVTVTVVQVTTTRDKLSRETYETVEQDIADVMVAPVTRTELDKPSGGDTVAATATFYLPVALDLNADDLILHDGHEWRVSGGSLVWVDQTEVTATRGSAF